MRIAVVGAPGTGKTSLVTALRRALGLGAGSSLRDTVDECVALERADGYNFVLLMGQDLPLTARSHGTAEASAPGHQDARLRQQLSQHALAYAVVYGSGQARTDCALQAIDFHRRRATARQASGASAWHWNCENCSDAACEHRLFSSLMNRPPASVGQ